MISASCDDRLRNFDQVRECRARPHSRGSSQTSQNRTAVIESMVTASNSIPEMGMLGGGDWSSDLADSYCIGQPSDKMHDNVYTFYIRTGD